MNILDLPYHSQLESMATKHLKDLGFLVPKPVTYHELMTLSEVDRLKVMNDATSLYVRARADRCAFHSIYPVSFEFDLKTHSGRGRYNDMTLEAYPIALHKSKSLFGVRCLYIYWNPRKNYHVGFWLHSPPPIRVIHIPNRWNDAQKKWFRTIFQRMFTGVDVVEIPSTYGSGDPYLIIDEKEVQKLPHWRDCVLDALFEAVSS